MQKIPGPRLRKPRQIASRRQQLVSLVTKVTSCHNWLTGNLGNLAGADHLATTESMLSARRLTRGSLEKEFAPEIAAVKGKCKSFELLQ